MSISDLEVHLAPKTVFTVHLAGLNLPVTNSMITMWIVMALMIILALVARWKMQYLPRGFQNLVEWALGGMHNFMKEVGGEAAQKHFPIFITFFLTILFCNW